VAALSNAVLVPHAAPGGKIWETAATGLARGQRVITFDDEENKAFIEAGAIPVEAPGIVDVLHTGYG